MVFSFPTLGQMFLDGFQPLPERSFLAQKVFGWSLKEGRKGNQYLEGYPYASVVLN